MSVENTQARCPVIEFDYLQGGCPVNSGFERMTELAKLGPVVEAESHHGLPGFLIATNTESLTEAFQDPQRFSSHSVIAIEPDPEYLMIPVQLDPPLHSAWRKNLAPFFTPARVREYEEGIRARCIALIDEIEGKDAVDFTEEFAVPFPNYVFMEILGLPVEKFDQFMVWENTIMHATTENDPDRSRARQAMVDVATYFGEVIAARRADPALRSNDLISAALEWAIDGEPAKDEDLQNLCMFLFIAGLDTVAAQLAAIFHHLASHPENRARIIDDPEIIPHAIEEMLRAFPNVATARKAVSDTEIAGVQVKAGQMILLPTSAAGRDPNVFENPDVVDFDRDVIRHLTFGAGAHRCVGSHLARLELKVALEEWHKRLPEYSLEDPEAITEHGGGAQTGIDKLRLVLSK